MSLSMFVCAAVFTSLYSLYLMGIFAVVSLAKYAVPGVCNVAPGAALAVRQSSLLQSDFLKVEQGTGVPAAALSA